MSVYLLKYGVQLGLWEIHDSQGRVLCDRLQSVRISGVVTLETINSRGWATAEGTLSVVDRRAEIVGTRGRE